MPQQFVAVDLGASTIRVSLGNLDRGRFDVELVAATQNRPLQRESSQHWDFESLMRDVARGVAAASKGRDIESVGIDAWGVDFGLVDQSGKLIDLPYHYRDIRTRSVFAALSGTPLIARAYRTTGIQNLPINTLYQLLATDPKVLARADTLLFIPDLIVHEFTGNLSTELTIASTSQLLDAQHRTWAISLCDALGIPSNLLPPILPSGSPRGKLRADAARRFDLDPGLRLVSPASHDTASAVVAIPAETDAFAFISSGTWSIVGMEKLQPNISEQARVANISNEAGVDGKTRLVRNVMGLWLLEQSRRVWARDGHDFSRSELLNLAENSSASAVFDPDHPSFLGAEDVPALIREQCRLSGQQTPDGVADIVRCILLSLAVAYRRAVQDVAIAAGFQPEVIHIVGGGSENRFLCSLTSSACGLPVVAGPREATTLGNLLIQAEAAGALDGRRDVRAVARSSTTTRTHRPIAEQIDWLSSAFETYMSLLSHNDNGPVEVSD